MIIHRALPISNVILNLSESVSYRTNKSELSYLID